MNLRKADMSIVRAFIPIHKFLKGRAAVPIAIAMVFMLPAGCSSQGSGTRQVTAPQDTFKIEVLESIELKRRNWENHGTDVNIDQDGSFTVTAIYLGRSKIVREGRLSASQLDILRRQIEKTGFFNLPSEYKAPFKTNFQWWGYDLTIKADHASKAVRFHSEDETVPESLNQLLEVILNLTK
jgi:hypothetical protein